MQLSVKVALKKNNRGEDRLSFGPTSSMAAWCSSTMLNGCFWSSCVFSNNSLWRKSSMPEASLPWRRNEHYADVFNPNHAQCNKIQQRWNSVEFCFTRHATSLWCCWLDVGKTRSPELSRATRSLHNVTLYRRRSRPAGLFSSSWWFVLKLKLTTANTRIIFNIFFYVGPEPILLSAA